MTPDHDDLLTAGVQHGMTVRQAHAMRPRIAAVAAGLVDRVAGRAGSTGSGTSAAGCR